MSTIKAVVIVKGVGIDTLSNAAFVGYGINFSGSVLDETNDHGVATDISGFVLIPIDTSFKKSDSLIRDAASASALSAGFVIGPDDIYIPFS